ncbi:hypothetical protein V8F06_012129 [Rhypophila decipiens]
MASSRGEPRGPFRTGDDIHLDKKLENAFICNDDLGPDSSPTTFLPYCELMKLLSEHEIRLALEEGENMSKIVPYIREHAPKTFAILVYIGCTKWISGLWRADFMDDKLPIVNDDLFNILSRDSRQSLNRVSELRGQVRSFIQSQWLFTAVAYDLKSLKHREIDHRHRIPFLQKVEIDRGGFSVVWKTVLHKEYLLYDKEHLITIKGNAELHPVLALKELTTLSAAGREEIGIKDSLSEASILMVMNEINHTHLIHTIAHYTQNRKDYFLFPFATHGSLRKYWTTKPPVVDARYVRWLIVQMLGLADAIRELHEKNCRHGDLKPENILCFSTEGTGGESEVPTLVIADVGLAKIHEEITAKRYGPTTTKAGTVMYSPPEYEYPNQAAPWSRLFDVWSLGCVFLEFVVWMLEGPDGLTKFRNSIAPESATPVRRTFYAPSGTSPVESLIIRTEIGNCIDQLLKDKRASLKTGLRGVLRLIANEMIVVALPEDGAADANEIAAVTRRQHNVEENEEDVFHPSSVPERNSSQKGPGVTIRVPTGLAAADMQKRRIKTGELVKKLEKIVKEIDDGLIQALTPNGEEGEATSVPPRRQTPAGSGLEVPSPGKRQNPTDKFAEKWEYTPDIEISLKILRYLAHHPDQYPHPSSTPSPLCSRCAGLKLLSPNSRFCDTLAGLTEKKPHCALCTLLYSWYSQRYNYTPNTSSVPKEDPINGVVDFSRAASYLATGQQREQRVASVNLAQDGILNPPPNQPSFHSLIRPPFLVAYSQGVQPGFPILPELGGALHIKILSLWLEACDANHSCFPKSDPKFLPTRLIDVSPDSTANTVCLLYSTESLDVSTHYLALSHRWGPPHLDTTSDQPLQAKKKVRTTQISDTKSTSGTVLLHREITVESLPATFHDAILITRGLGVRYLWIDSLCIIQDSPEDWMRESTLMESVFSGAYCTIAAASASGTDDGFLRNRQERERKIVVMRGNDEICPEFYVSEMVDDFEQDVGQNELQRRGWVLQERALSRRTIHFAARQTYWECGEGVRCETLTKTNNDKAAFLGDAYFPSYADKLSKGKRIMIIQGLYEQYSAMGLTYARDRPAAIRGLEARLIKTIGGPGGFGIFRQHLHRYLLWRRASENGPGLQRVTDFLPPSTPPPSWSWMAYSGEIKYVDVPGAGVEWNGSLIWPQSESDPTPGHLEAAVWEIAESKDMKLNDKETWISMDGPLANTVKPTKCVIVGISKSKTPYCLVLIVGTVDAPTMRGAGLRHLNLISRAKARLKRDSLKGVWRAWERLGVGMVQQSRLVFESERDGHLDWIV